MTTTDDRPTTTCPSWCNQGSSDYPCRGEHYSESICIPATAGRPENVEPMAGATFPVVGVAIVYSEGDGDQAPFINLGSSHSAADLDLRVPEARALIRALQQAVDTIEGLR